MRFYLDKPGGQHDLDFTLPWEIISFDGLCSGTEEAWWFLTTMFDIAKKENCPMVYEEADKNLVYIADYHDSDSKDDVEKIPYLDVEKNGEWTQRCLYIEPNYLREVPIKTVRT